MPNKILVSKNFGGGNPAVYEQAGVSLRQIGADIPASMEGWTGLSEPKPVNRAAEFNGDKYVIHDDSVYMLSASGTWDVDFTASIVSPVNTDTTVGLFPILVGASGSYLCYVWKSTVGNVHIARKSSAGSWNEVTTALTDFAGSSTAGLKVAFSILVDNTVYWGYADDFDRDLSYYYGANLETQGAWEMPVPSIPTDSNVNSNNFVGGYGSTSVGAEFYFTLGAGRDFTGTRVYDSWLYRISGGILDKVSLISRTIPEGSTRTGLRTDANTGHRDGLVRKDGNIYAIVWATGTTDFDEVTTENSDLLPDDGWSMHKLVPSGSTFIYDSEITDTVLPKNLRRDASVGGNGDVGARYAGQWSPLIQLNPSGQEEILLYYANDTEPGTLRNLYRFNNDTSELELLDIGSDASLSMPTYTRGNGSYESNIIESWIEGLTENESRAGESYVDVRIKGSGQPVTMHVIFDSDKNTPDTSMVFTSASSGVLISGNTVVSGIVADESILYRMSWQAETQGVPFGRKTPMQPRITLL